MTIEERMLTLELELRKTKLRLRSVSAAIVLVVLVYAIYAAANAPSTPDEVTARRFVVVDAMGRPRASLEMFPRDDGLGLRGPALTLADEAGSVQAQLLAELDSSQLMLKGVPGGYGMMASARADGSGVSVSGDRSVFPFIEMSVNGDTPRIGIMQDGLGYKWAVP